MKSCEKRAGFGCLVPCALVKMAGAVMVAVGVLLALIFIPIRMWLALLGVALAVAGALLMRMA